MSNSSEFYFTDNKKILAEQLNDAILVTNAFDLTIPIKMPSMFVDGSFMDTTESRKCGMSIVTLNSSLPNGMSINNDGELTGTGTVQLRFYPNFNTFGCIKKMNWTNDGTITINLKKTDNTSIIDDVTKNEDISESQELNKLQEIIIEMVFTSATLTELEVTIENDKETRYGARISKKDVDGLVDDLRTIENINTQQDIRLNQIDNINSQQNNRMDIVEDYELKYYQSLSASNYNPVIDSDVTITFTITDMYNSPINNKSVTLYRNGNAVGTSTTNSSGVATWTVNCNDWGVQDFSVKNTHCQVYVTGWRQLNSFSPTEGGIMRIFRNKTHGRLVLDNFGCSVNPSYYVDDNNIKHNWKTINNTAYLKNIVPRNTCYCYATDTESDLYNSKRIRAVIQINAADAKIHYTGFITDSHNWSDRQAYTYAGETEYAWGNPYEWLYDDTALNADFQWAIKDELL